MFKHLNYRTTRALQICIVFATTILVQQWLNYAHVGLVGFTVMIIYAGFDVGATLQRTTERYLGMLLGLLLAYFLWILGEINYRFILMVVPIIVFMAYFSLNKSFVYAVTFTVTLSALGTDFYTKSDFSVPSFFFEYALSTTVAYLICIIFDAYIFKNIELSRKFYIDLQKESVDYLNDLLNIVTHYPIRQSRYLKKSAEFNVKMLELYGFVNMVTHDPHINFNLLDELTFFSSEIQQAYDNIRRLAISPQKNDLVEMETNYILTQLAQINKNQRIKYMGAPIECVE